MSKIGVFLKKRIVPPVICAAMVITMSDITNVNYAKQAKAAESEVTDIVATVPSKGEGTKESPYIISTAGELFGYAAIVNGDETVCDGENVKQNNKACAKLGADIDLKKKEWTPIGTKKKDASSGAVSYDSSFLGNFDGDGHKITNMVVKSEDEDKPAGFFGCIGNETKLSSIYLKNLTIGEGSSVEAKKAAAAFVGEITQYANVYMNNCINKADVTISYGKGTDAGSMAGTCLGHIGIYNCMNTGKITAPKCVTAVAGWIASGEVNSFLNVGEVNSSSGHYGEKEDGDYGDFFARGYFTSNNNVSLKTADNYKSDKCTMLSEKEIMSGKAAYLLNGRKSGNTEDGINWGQNLSQDDMPVLYKYEQEVPESSIVYYGYKDCTAKTKSYTNDKAVLKHQKAGHLYKDDSDNDVNNCVFCGEKKETKQDEDKDDSDEPATYDKPVKLSKENIKEYNLEDKYIGYYAIKTADELIWFSKYLNKKYTAKTDEEQNEIDNCKASVVLLNDIDLTGKKWTKINSYYGYDGIFDGRNHVISNLKCKDYSAAMFDNIKDTSVVKNVGLKNVDIYGESDSAAIANYNYGKIINCYSTGTIRSEYGDVAGICMNNSDDYDGKIMLSYSTCLLDGNNCYGIDRNDGWGKTYNCYALSDYEVSSSSSSTTEAPSTTGYSLNSLLNKASIVAVSEGPSSGGPSSGEPDNSGDPDEDDRKPELSAEEKENEQIKNTETVYFDEDEFKNGHVAYLLNKAYELTKDDDGLTDVDDAVWGQTLEGDNAEESPVFDGKKVYKVEVKCGSYIKTTSYSYSNDNNIDEEHHFNVNGLCVNCKKRKREVSVDISNWYYGENPKTPVAASKVKADDDEISYYYAKEGGVASKTAPTAEGKYYVIAEYKETEKYVSAYAKKDFEISRKDFGDVKAEKKDTNKGNNGWYKGDVTLKAPDGYYISDTDEIDSFGNLEEIKFSETGDSLLYYLRSKDTNAISGAIRDEVKIDRNAPVIDEGSTTYSQGTGNLLTNLWNTIIGKEVITVTTTVSDAESGISTERISATLIDISGNEKKADGVSVVSDASGKYKVSFLIPADFAGTYKLNISDIAGNEISEASKQNIVADTKAPEMEVKVNDTTYTQKVVCADKAEVVLSVKDVYASSGIKSVSYTVDGQSEIKLEPSGKKFADEKITEYVSDKITISTEGLHIIKAKAVDNSENETDKKYEIEIKTAKEPENTKSAEVTTGPKATTGPTVTTEPSGQPTSTSKPDSKSTLKEDLKNIGKTKVSKNLALKLGSNTKTVTIKWNKIKSAARYEIYSSVYKNKKYSLKKIADISKKTTKYKHTKLKKNTGYAYQIVAYKLVKGNKKYIAKYYVQIVYTSGNKKYRNASSLNVANDKLSIKVKKTAKIDATAKAPKGKKLRSKCKEIVYISSDTKIATVTSDGKVKGKKKGQCVIYCITHNGINKNVNVTVKKAKKK